MGDPVGELGGSRPNTWPTGEFVPGRWESSGDFLRFAPLSFSMSTRIESAHRPGQAEHSLHAYGLVDAVLGYVVFYVFVSRATPTVVELLVARLPDLSASAVRTGLAAALWFVLVVTLLDQLRKQVAAYRGRVPAGVPSESRALGYLGLVLGGGLVAAWTFDRAIEMGISLIRLVGTLDTSLFAPVEFVVMVVFFVTFGVASWALDRLVIGGVRSVVVR